MKKALVLLLTLVLVMGMAVPAFAVDSPTADQTDADATAALPVVVEEEEAKEPVIILTAVEDAKELPADAQAAFAEAQASLKEVVPEKMTPMYFFYVTIKDPAVTKMTVQVESVKEVSDIVVMQFVDGEWVELEVELDEAGNVVILGLQEGPMAIFTRK